MGYSLRNVIAIKVIEQIQNPDHGHESEIEFPSERLLVATPIVIDRQAFRIFQSIITNLDGRLSHFEVLGVGFLLIGFHDGVEYECLGR